VRSLIATDAKMVDPRKYIGKARGDVASEVARLLTLLNLG